MTLLPGADIVGGDTSVTRAHAPLMTMAALATRSLPRGSTRSQAHDAASDAGVGQPDSNALRGGTTDP